ncbi:MAG: hypothetical protein IMZ46_16425 [Acidobacteria bacterium]|nr:hypothetical protein [Acidobacteriota bacterium]
MIASLSKNGATISSGDIANLIARDLKVHLNLGQEAIFTTEDKVRIVLMNCIDKFESRKAWIAPLSVLITIVAVFVTTSFKDFHLLKAAVSEALFIFIALACAVWLVRTLIRVRKAPSVDDIVSDIKKSAAAKNALDAFTPEFWKDYMERVPSAWQVPNDRLL